jgi:hypothetical protein
MAMRHYRYLVVLIVVLIPAVTMAAGLADQVSNVGGGTFDRAVSSLSGVQVVAAKGSSNASVKVSRTSSWTESFTDPNKNSGPGVATFTVWSLVASAPLNKNDDDTDVANLDGLVNASSLELTYSRFQVPGKRNPVMTPAIIAKLDAVCKRVYQAMKDQTGSSPEPSKGCESAEVVEYGSSGDQHDFESAFWDISNSNPWIWGAKAKLGYQNFEFIDATAVAKHKQSETPWAVGAFIAYNPDAWRSMFTLSAQYQDAFQNSANGTVCPAPDGSGTPLSCLNGPIGNPKETKGMQVSFEARRDFGFAATGLTATYDFEKKILGVELPVYFVKDKDGKFNAGIKGGWRDDTHDFTVSVFVSSTFGLFE